MIIEEMKKKIKDRNKILVLPEGDDIRILRAAIRLKKENLCKPLLLGEKEKIEELATKNNLSIDGLDILNPIDDDEFEKAEDYFNDLLFGEVDYDN